MWRARASSTATGRGPTGVPSMCRFGLRHAARHVAHTMQHATWLTPCSTPRGSPHAADMQHARWHAIRQGGWRGMPCRHSLRGAVCVVVSAEHISDACNVQYHTWHRPGLSPLPHDAVYSSRSPSSAHRRARLCRACTHVHGRANAPICMGCICIRMCCTRERRTVGIGRRAFSP